MTQQNEAPPRLQFVKTKTVINGRSVGCHIYCGLAAVEIVKWWESTKHEMRNEWKW